MAKAFKIMMDQGLLVMREHCDARRVSPWIRFAAQFGTPVITPGDEGLQGHEEDVFLDRLPPLSSSTAEITAAASKPREHAQHGLRGVRIGEAEHPGPETGTHSRASSVAKNEVKLGDVGVHSPGNGTQVLSPLTAHAETVSWQERLAHARGPSYHSQRPVLVRDCLLPIAVDPELCLCAGRRFRKLVRIHMQIRDVADGVRVDKDNLDVGGARLRHLILVCG